MIEPLILHIETATPICSVCLSKGEKTLSFIEEKTANSHAKMLVPLIQDVLKANALKASDLHAIAVSEGPGSYTGLRIGLSTAKAICYANNIPLIMVNTLLAMAQGMKENARIEENEILIPVLDARRIDVYWNAYNSNLSPINETACSSFIEVSEFVLAHQHKAIIAGTGAFKFEKNEPLFTLNFENVIGAKYLIPFALAKYYAAEFSDLAYSEPYYRQ